MVCPILASGVNGPLRPLQPDFPEDCTIFSGWFPGNVDRQYPTTLPEGLSAPGICRIWFLATRLHLVTLAQQAMDLGSSRSPTPMTIFIIRPSLSEVNVEFYDRVFFGNGRIPCGPVEPGWGGRDGSSFPRGKSSGSADDYPAHHAQVRFLLPQAPDSFQRCESEVTHGVSGASVQFGSSMPPLLYSAAQLSCAASPQSPEPGLTSITGVSHGASEVSV